MARIFRISGYLVDKDEDDTKEYIEEMLKDEGVNGFLVTGELWQQLHVQESESFELDGEDEPNCDLALLTRHFKKDVPKEYTRGLVVGGKYRHFKLGKIVTVIGISRHTETEEVTVVYKYEGKIWNRPLEMFLSEVDKEKYPNATQKYRFELVESTGLTDRHGNEIFKVVESEDVCEWHKVKNGNAYKCNTHAEIYDSRVLDWYRCPYCEKKIRVVESEG